MKIYFARSICGASSVNVEELQSSIGQFGELLSENFDYSFDVSRDKKIFETDLKMLRSSDAVVVEVSNPSIGVGYELATAEMLKKPVLCLGKEGVLLTAMVTGNDYFIVKRYSSLDEAIVHVRDFLKQRNLFS